MAQETGMNEYTRFVSTPMSYPMSDEWNARGRYRRFSGTQGVDFTGTNGNTVPICQNQSGDRMMGGYVAFGAGGAGATIQFGIVGTPAKYSGAIAAAAAGTSTALIDTLADNYGVRLTANEIMIITFAGANFGAGILIAGHVLYIPSGG